MVKKYKQIAVEIKHEIVLEYGAKICYAEKGKLLLNKKKSHGLLPKLKNELAKLENLCNGWQPRPGELMTKRFPNT